MKTDSQTPHTATPPRLFSGADLFRLGRIADSGTRGAFDALRKIANSPELSARALRKIAKAALKLAQP